MKTSLQCLCALFLSLTAVAAPKLVVTGWDSPTASEFRQHIGEFEQWPLDGTTIIPTLRTTNGLDHKIHMAFNRDKWDFSLLMPMISNLKEAKPKRAVNNFLKLSANPGDIDWFDDAGWTEIVDHWRLLARAAKQAGLRGICFDSECYTPPWSQFSYFAQPAHLQHTFEDYRVCARLRGRAVMQAVSEEFPEATIFCFRIFSELLPLLNVVGDPQRMLATQGSGLMPAFFNGWLDVAPPTIMFIEGDEDIGYTANSDADYYRAYALLRTSSQTWIVPENRSKYRSQVRVSHGFYLDAYVNARGSKWYIDPLGDTPAGRFGANLSFAFSASDADLIWFDGEQARWWPPQSQQRPFWGEKFIGLTRSMELAKDPIAFARKSLAGAKLEDNLLTNCNFSATPFTDGSPSGWWFWQADSSKGTVKQGEKMGSEAARLEAVQNGCIGQVLRVVPNESYAIEASINRVGSGEAFVMIGWKDKFGHWTEATHNAFIVPEQWESSLDWNTAAGLVQVPAQATQLVVMLSVKGQINQSDQAWFKKVRIIRL